MLVFGAFRVLTAVELDNQAPLTTNEVDVVAIDRLLASEFEATELATANVGPQPQFCRRERAPQRSRALIALLVLTAQRGHPSAYEACPPPPPPPPPRAGRGGCSREARDLPAIIPHSRWQGRGRKGIVACSREARNHARRHAH